MLEAPCPSPSPSDPPSFGPDRSDPEEPLLDPLDPLSPVLPRQGEGRKKNIGLRNLSQPRCQPNPGAMPDQGSCQPGDHASL